MTLSVGHVNLTLDVPISSYHDVYINYYSRYDKYAPLRSSIDVPINNGRIKKLNQFTHGQILSDSRDLPVRNFTRYHAVNNVHEIIGQNSIEYINERINGYSSVSEPLLDIRWNRNNVTSQYLSLLIVTPSNHRKPVTVVNRNCISNHKRVGTHLLDIDHPDYQVLQENVMYGSYVHQWHFIPGCQTPSYANGCMNGTISISTPSRPGDYRLQLLTLTNSTIGSYKEVIRRSIGNGNNNQIHYNSNDLRTNKTILTCGGDSSSSSSNDISTGNTTSGLLPLIDIALLEVTADVLLHVQYTINIGIPYYHVKTRDTIRRGQESNRMVNIHYENDIINPFIPVHLNILEGDPYQEYTIEFSTNPSMVTNDSGITIQIIDTCSISENNKEYELLNIQNESLTVHTINIKKNHTSSIAGSESDNSLIMKSSSYSSSFTSKVILSNVPTWNTTITKPIIHHIQVRTYDNVIQNDQSRMRCLLKHFITPTNGNYNKWDVALVLGSRERVKWQHPTLSLFKSNEVQHGDDREDTPFEKSL